MFDYQLDRHIADQKPTRKARHNEKAAPEEIGTVRFVSGAGYAFAQPDGASLTDRAASIYVHARTIDRAELTGRLKAGDRIVYCQRPEPQSRWLVRGRSHQVARRGLNEGPVRLRCEPLH